MKKTTRIALIALSALMLFACGGGADSGDDDPKTITKSFSLNLDSVDVQRISNGNALVVDVSDITSGALIMSEKR